MSLTALAADKTAAWSPLYYGELPYLLAAVASGAGFQIFAIERDNPSEPRAVNPRLRLTLPAAQAVATVAVISLYRLLRATTALLPDHILPVDLVQKRTHHEGYTRTNVGVLLCSVLYQGSQTMEKASLVRPSLMSALHGMVLQGRANCMHRPRAQQPCDHFILTLPCQGSRPVHPVCSLLTSCLSHTYVLLNGLQVLQE